ncbi:MAG: hypothetical protein FWD80_06285 [Propionibacteriaceae bacterium]|nr:hypothetical protein [Propionibacteriaceae bacterium]
MVGTLVRLQLKLQWRQIRTSVGMTVASLIMVLLVLGSAIPAMFGLAAMRGASIETRGTVMTFGFALLTLGWPIMVTMMTGSNDMLDAGRFALYPVRAARMLPGLLVSATMGLGGVLIVIMGIGYVMAWSTSLASAVAAIIGLLLGFAICIVSSRAVSALLADLLRRRRARDLVMVVFVLVVLALSMGVQFVSQSLGGQLDAGFNFGDYLNNLVTSMQPAAKVAAWTPFGWAWALPWAVANGTWWQAGVWLVLAVVWLGLLGWVWARQFARSLVSPLESGGGAEKIAKANPFDRFLPNSVAGAIAKRSLRYWRRDPRRLVGAIAIVLMPLIMAVAMYASSRSVPPDQMHIMKSVVAFAPALLGWMAATSVGWDISYDGSALATQIVTGASGRDDRWGRMLAWLVIFVPIQVVYIIGFMLVASRWDLLPAVTGLCVAELLTGGGIGSWIGSVWQMPQPPAGSNMMGRGATGGMAGFVGAMVGLLLPIVIGLPALVLAIAAVMYGEPFGWLTLLVGAATGWLVLWWGIRAGGRRLDRTWPEVLAKVTWKG